jgi:hypothetical protein
VNLYSFDLGTESWVELLDTEGREVASSRAGAVFFVIIDCHFDVVILSRSLNNVWSDGAGLPSRWYIAGEVNDWEKIDETCNEKSSG